MNGTTRRILPVLIGLAMALPVQAQELDLDGPPPRSAPSSPVPKSAPAPFQVSVTKTLYLPPAMYGQWNVVGTLLETNAEDFFNPVVNDIWMLERSGDAVVITNPANGASAAVSVDEVRDNQATFSRRTDTGRNRIYSESYTIAVNGDTMVGFSINRRTSYDRHGRVVKTYYGRYRMEATRIGGGRIQFKPEVQEEPSFVIEDVQPIFAPTRPR